MTTVTESRPKPARLDRSKPLPRLVPLSRRARSRVWDAVLVVGTMALVLGLVIGCDILSRRLP